MFTCFTMENSHISAVELINMTLKKYITSIVRKLFEPGVIHTFKERSYAVRGS